MSRTKTIEWFFVGTVILGAGLFLGLFASLWHLALQLLVPVAAAIVLLGLFVLPSALGWRFNAWLWGWKARR